ncbi:MAG: heme ABC transporter permease [Alphaproteobacteria bacterium]|nr:heme ABC transporter permease [Alphaproteobacteria bacterium]
MFGLQNPTKFLKFAKLVGPWLAGSTILLIGSGLWFGLFNSPADYQQGETVRIMYIHVPSAWMGMFAYSVMAIASAIALVWKHPVADHLARGSAPLGAAFTLICLVSGALWGKPMWGTWWVWDARLTSMLILFFLYLGYMALAGAFDDPERGAKASAILAVVGWINVPIIKFSVDWWNTLHQPASVTKTAMPSIDPAMLLPLLLMGVGFTTFYATLLLWRVRAEILATRIRNIRLAQIHAEGA